MEQTRQYLSVVLMAAFAVGAMALAWRFGGMDDE